MKLHFDFGIGKFYIIPLFLIFFIRSNGIILFLALLGLTLLTVGFLASPHGTERQAQEVLTNRFFAALIICCVAWLAMRYHRSVMGRERSEAALREAHRIARLGHFELVPGSDEALFCSPECLRILGRDNADGLGFADFLDGIVHPEDRRNLMRQARTALAQSGQYDVEFRIVRPDGDVRDVLSSGQLRTAGKGPPGGVTGTLFDVSEWRRAERARRDSEARMKSILDAVPEALVIIDRDGAIQTFSASAEALFGHRAREVIGRSVGLLMAPDCREEHRRFLRAYIEMGKGSDSGSRRLCAERKDGTTFPIELTVSEVWLDAQTLLTIFIRDLTESQRMEEELRQSQKVEAIGQLTGGIAHDFNNLLTVIMGNLEILEARLAQQPLQALVRTTRDTAELGAQLTGRLLTFGRRQPLDAKRVDLRRLIGDFESLLSRSLGEDIALKSHLAPNLPPVLVDPAQFQVALFNLALNAKDAMPSGGALSIAVTVVGADDRDGVPSEVPAGSFVMVEVRDTGSGMPDHVRRRALEPFFTTKESGAGTGLGLPMVYGFIKQSNGYLDIDSEPGRGTAIRLYLPSAPGGRLDSLVPSAFHAELSGEGEKILVVEDDPRVRQVNAARLKDLGYLVVDAASGAEALEKLAATADVDLLFSDYVMPGGMNGGELARAARALRPGIGTLLTSGYARPEQVRSGRIEGATWLTKPYKTGELARAVRKALDARLPRRRRRPIR